jgi:hypothetical protein
MVAPTPNPLRFYGGTCPMKAIRDDWPLLLRYSVAIGSVANAWVRIERFSP